MPTFRRNTASSKPKTIRSGKFTVRKAEPPKKVVKSPPPDSEVKVHAKKTLTALDDLLHTPPQASAMKPPAVETHENAVYQEDSLEFNGISDLDEQKEYFGEVVGYERKKARVVEEQLKILERDRDEERKKLEKEIRSLKEELHRTTPLHDNKFFSLSKELRTAVAEIERIASDQGIAIPVITDAPASVDPTPSLPAAPSPILAPAVPPPAPTLTPTVPKMVEKAPEPVATPAAPVEKKRLSKQKALITGVVATALVLAGTSLFSEMFMGKSNVDQKIVNSYLTAQAGQVEGAQTETKDETDPSQADVSFEQSTWEDFNDPTFGIMLQYPKNAVKAVRTDSNVTFIRKTGYLFKVQRIETALTVEEYWKQIKATSLNYTTKDDKFKGKPALKLELQDLADYPGDRYLVKEGAFIYDVWYATPSKNFTQDDIKRSEKMLASLSVVGAR